MLWYKWFVFRCFPYTWWFRFIKICLKNMYLLLSLHVDSDIQFSNAVKEKYIKMLYLFTSYSRMDTTYFFKPVSSVDVEDLVHFSITWSHLKGKNRAVGKSLKSTKQHLPFFVSSRTETEQHDFRNKLCYQLLESKYPKTQGQVTEQALSLKQREERGGKEVETAGRVFLQKWILFAAVEWLLL